MPNYFAYETAAQRYARSRPYFHPLVMEKIAQRLPGGHVGRALDVACGTGQSSTTLAEIATSVIAADSSPEMIAVARRSPGIAYVIAPAERLPFAGGAFDLLTVALAFHWFRRDEFLAEASRVLAPGGWLVIYNNWHTGRMKENPAFEEWTRGPFISRYPSPPRDRRPPEGDEVARFGLVHTEREAIENDVRFAPEELVDYLTTQTNVIAAVERGSESLEGARSWLLAEARPLFPAEICTFVFGGAIDYICKWDA